MNLPSISNDRILVKSCSSLYILDFNQHRLAEFLSKTQEQREQLKAVLHHEVGQVQFVMRHYYWGDVDGMEDQEFLDAQKPPEWKAYLRTSPSPLDTDHSLQFDEPPEEHRVPIWKVCVGTRKGGQYDVLGLGGEFSRWSAGGGEAWMGFRLYGLNYVRESCF